MPSPGYKKFTRDQRKVLCKFIRGQTTSDERDYIKLAQTLNEAGHATPSGAPWDNLKVGTFIKCHLPRLVRRRGAKPRPTRVAVERPTRAADDTLTLAEIVLQANLSANDKRRLLGAMFK